MLRNLGWMIAYGYEPLLSIAPILRRRGAGWRWPAATEPRGGLAGECTSGDVAVHALLDAIWR